MEVKDPTPPRKTKFVKTLEMKHKTIRECFWTKKVTFSGVYDLGAIKWESIFSFYFPSFCLGCNDFVSIRQKQNISILNWWKDIIDVQIQCSSCHVLVTCSVHYTDSSPKCLLESREVRYSVHNTLWPPPSDRTMGKSQKLQMTSRFMFPYRCEVVLICFVNILLWKIAVPYPI